MKVEHNSVSECDSWGRKVNFQLCFFTSACDDDSRETLHSSYNLTSTLASVIHCHRATPREPLVLQVSPLRRAAHVSSLFSKKKINTFVHTWGAIFLQGWIVVLLLSHTYHSVFAGAAETDLQHSHLPVYKLYPWAHHFSRHQYVRANSYISEQWSWSTAVFVLLLINRITSFFFFFFATVSHTMTTSSCRASASWLTCVGTTTRCRAT